MGDVGPRGTMRDERDRAAETAPGDPEVARSPLSSASGKCALVHQGPRPLPSLLTPLICELRVDLIVPTPTWSLIHGCMRPRDRLLRVKFKLMERHLFRSVQTLEKCSRSARIVQKNRTVESGLKRGDSRPYVVL